MKYSSEINNVSHNLNINKGDQWLTIASVSKSKENTYSIYDVREQRAGGILCELFLVGSSIHYWWIYCTKKEIIIIINLANNESMERSPNDIA